MKKIALVFLVVFAALFVVLTIRKNTTATEIVEQGGSIHSDIEKENIIKFWDYYRKATDYRLDEEWESAVENYRAALELNGQHEDALYYLGSMCLELGRYKEAEEYWQKLVQINPRSSRAFMQLGNLYLSSETMFDAAKAETACRTALELNKEETGPLLFLGEVRLIRGQLDAAASDFEAVTASNYKSAEAYFLGGFIAWKKGNLAKARDLFSKAVKYSKPEDASPGKVMGEGDTKHGKGFGTVTSKSVLRQFMTALPDVEPASVDQALQKNYRSLEAFLAELKRRVH